MAQPAEEPLDRPVVEVGRVQVVGQRRAHLAPPALVVQLGAGDPEDAVVVGQLALEAAVVERGQQLAQREVAGAAEDDEVAPGGQRRRRHVRSGGVVHAVHGKKDLGTMQALLRHFTDQSNGRLCSRA